jgi:TonB family protein
VPRPPTTGAQVTRGTAAADVGATGQGTGLTIGGGAGGASVTVDADFCCKEYIEELLRRIRAQWKNVQDEAGTTVMVFEIGRDGSYTGLKVEKSSGSTMLDIASRAAFTNLKLPPLPDQYKEPTLKIHLAFPYQR